MTAPIVYLNGTEVVRSNMPAPSTGATLALDAVDAADETTFFPSRINSTLLRTGTNVLAVEIHQSSRSSSDISFDLALSASVRVQALRPTVIQPPESQIALVGDTVTFKVVATGTPPLAYRWRHNNRFIEAAYSQTSSSFTLTNVQLTNAGIYTVAITNPATSSFQSPAAALEVMEDRDSDRMGDSWESIYGFSSDNPSDAGDDADGDTISNYHEFLAGTNPRDPASYLKFDSISSSANTISLQFMAASNRNYTVLYREPDNASWLKFTDALGRATNRIERILDLYPTNAQRWYRLRTPGEP